MKRREAILAAAKEALESEQAESSGENQTSNKENKAAVDTVGTPIEDEFKACSLSSNEPVNPGSGGNECSDPAIKGAIPYEDMQ